MNEPLKEAFNRLGQAHNIITLMSQELHKAAQYIGGYHHADFSITGRLEFHYGAKEYAIAAARKLNEVGYQNIMSEASGQFQYDASFRGVIDPSIHIWIHVKPVNTNTSQKVELS